MHRGLFALLASLPYLPLAGADNGLITTRCPFTVDETPDRLEQALTRKGMTSFTRIDHTEGIAKAGTKSAAVSRWWKRCAR
jgi:hypothetical protein